MNYYLVSVVHTTRDLEHILFWGPNGRGYTPVLGAEVGVYDEAGAAAHVHSSTIAVPVEAVQALLSPVPYHKYVGRGVCRFYDQVGPVVQNTKENWQALIAARLWAGKGTPARVKFEYFRRTPQSVPLAQLSAMGKTILSGTQGADVVAQSQGTELSELVDAAYVQGALSTVGLSLTEEPEAPGTASRKAKLLHLQALVQAELAKME